MTSHLNSHGTTDIKPEMLSGVQTGNGPPHDIYNIRSIAHAWTNTKDDIFMQRRLVQNFTSILEWGKGLVYWRSTHSAGHIPGIFFPGCCLLRFAAFFHNVYKYESPSSVSLHKCLAIFPFINSQFTFLQECKLLFACSFPCFSRSFCLL